MKGYTKGEKPHPEVEPIACSTMELWRLHLWTSDRGVVKVAEVEEEVEEGGGGGE